MANLSVSMAVLELTNAATIKLEAYDSSGSAVAGVNITQVAITAVDLTPSVGSGIDNTPPPLLVPANA